ncbi:MAG TPA: glycosyltransferase 87 family protein [Gaiellaceae bacterium]|nr:glycosyltransferase 87 family protein [Gaiellaceae bacterium]
MRYGLPYPLLNPDEQSIVPRAWEMTHGGGLDPGWYDYPSLVMELLAPFQIGLDEPSYFAARLVVVLVGVAGVAAAWWLGARAYGELAGFVAAGVTAVATTHVAYSRTAVTDVPFTTLATGSLALLVSRRLELAGVAAGLAAAGKYPGVVLLVPLIVAGWREWRRLGVAVGLGAVAFFAASPFVVVHAGKAWDDASRVSDRAREGWLGFEGDGSAPVAFADRLWEGIGPALLVAAVGLVLALVRRRPADLVLASFALAYFATLLPLDAHFDRYVLPLVPVLGALAGSVRALAPVTIVLLAVPLAWSIRDTRDLTRTDTREAAQAWIERRVPTAARVAADPSAPPFDRPVLRFQLPAPWQESDPRRDLNRLRRRGIDYVVVTGAVTDRVRAAAADYPGEARFYDQLEQRARPAYRIDPDGDYEGPWVAVYRLNMP